MKKATARKQLWLALGIFCAVSIVAGTPLLAYAALKGKYALMYPLIFIVAHGFLGVTPYFILFTRERTTLRLLPLLPSEGEVSYSDLAKKCGLTPEGARFFTERALKKRYIELKNN